MDGRLDEVESEDWEGLEGVQDAVDDGDRTPPTPTVNPGPWSRKVRRRWGTPEPVCALCARATGEDVATHHLTHGITVLLCETHRSDTYLRANGGLRLVSELTGLWAASGALTRRRRAALHCHLQRIQCLEETTRERPGSYSWPRLRAEAERRFSAGEAPDRVIDELRAQAAGGDAIVPSVRTMRRWFGDGRWLQPPIGFLEAEGSTNPDLIPPPLRRRTLLEFIDDLRDLGEPYSWAFYGWPRAAPRVRRR